VYAITPPPRDAGDADPAAALQPVASVNRRIYEALKPGGTYVVIDHAAEPGSGLRDTSTRHRIDERAVIDEVTAAGFEFAGRSGALRNPVDMHELPVFDDRIRGRTDQFALKFRKPAQPRAN
jgi:predicted methyltransferase